MSVPDGSSTVPPEPVVVDARGLRCPLPVIRLAAAARGARSGTLVTVLWTDPAARHDIPAWARMRGHELVGTDQLVDETRGARGRTVQEAAPAFATTVRIS